jgi:predicted HTH transcriptional regulator
LFLDTCLPLDHRQRLALAYLRLHREINNSEYRRLNHVDPLTAGADLRGLVQSGLVEQRGVSRWTSYALRVTSDVPQVVVPEKEEDKILSHVRKHGSISNAECRALLGVNEPRAYYLLTNLTTAGRLKPVKSGRWRRYVLP